MELCVGRAMRTGMVGKVVGVGQQEVEAERNVGGLL